MLEVTHALLNPETVLAAIDAVRGVPGPVALDGLIDLLYQPPSARTALNAIAALESRQEPIILDALMAALDSPHSLVRLAAVGSLHQRRQTTTADLLRLLERDPSWLVRRAALRALADGPEPDRWLVLASANDPHWRMRHALIQVLLEWGETESRRQEIDARLAPQEHDARAGGVRAYLHYRRSGALPDGQAQPLPASEPAWPFWDWDAAVLVRQLERLGEAGRRQAIDAMPQLLAHADSRVRSVALETLRQRGETRHLAEVVALLDEPRTDAIEAVNQLLTSLDLDRTEEVARFLLHLPNPTPAQLAWAIDQAGEAFPIEEEAELLSRLPDNHEQPRPVRCALARLTARWPDAARGCWAAFGLTDPHVEVQCEALRAVNQEGTVRLNARDLRRLLESNSPLLRVEAVKAVLRQEGDTSFPGQIDILGLATFDPDWSILAAADPDARVRICLAEGLVKRHAPQDEPLLARLQTDPHPRVRAAALTPARAAYLLEDPTRETSWHVLAAAARLGKVPFWKLVPKPPWQPPASAPAVPEPLRLERPAPRDARLLGPARLLVSPMGVSGHYGLPVEGFVRAAAAGVNLLFWEPNYQTLTEFLTRLPASQRNEFHVITGTFEADGKRVQRDAERALRLLQIDRIALFLLFWVQSWNRVTPDVREALERLQQKGLVASFSLSTHSRPLAVQAMQEGWNPLMVRHSAAHRGAEEQIFPRSRQLGTSIITFNNTCYGRLLQPGGDLPLPGAADCYRYTLAQPAVTACLSAPATLEELEENLAALFDPELPPQRRQVLLAHGDRVYQEDAVFQRLVRSR
jgi:HEAT repeat protein